MKYCTCTCKYSFKQEVIKCFIWNNLFIKQDLHELGVDLDGSLEDAHSGPGELDLSFGKKDAIIIEVCIK